MRSPCLTFSRFMVRIRINMVRFRSSAALVAGLVAQLSCPTWAGKVSNTKGEYIVHLARMMQY